MGDYVTVQQLRDEGITATIAADAKVLDAIRTWQEILDRACRQWFESRTLTLLVDGSDSDTLFFGVPIISITHLKLNGATTALDTDLYRVYSSRSYPDDRHNPRIKLIGDELRDIYTAPLSYGRLKFLLGRQNQEIKGAFGYIEDNVAAHGAVQFIAKASLVDGETFVLDDGVNDAVTFYFDQTGTYTPPGGYDDENVRVDVSGDTTADNVATTAKTAINAATALDITAGTVETGGLLRLENDTQGVAGNQAITETVTNSGFAVYGMAGGGVPRAITRALIKLVVEKLTNPIYGGGTVTPSPSALGSILQEKTDGHSIKYSPAGGGFSERKPGLSGITSDPEILDIITLYRAPLGVASPKAWSFT